MRQVEAARLARARRWHAAPSRPSHASTSRRERPRHHGGERPRVWVVEYTEVFHPTFIKTPNGEDIVASGKIWAEPTTGRVHRTLLTASIATITVNYALRPEVPGLWLPVTMEEQYSRADVMIKGKATYAKFRQFQVQTSEQVVLPKK